MYSAHVPTHTCTHTELSEFVLQLDEEVEAMQSTILHLQQQLKEAREAPTKTPPSKDRASKPNGPVDPNSTSTSGGPSRAPPSRSQDT